MKNIPWREGPQTLESVFAGRQDCEQALKVCGLGVNWGKTVQGYQSDRRRDDRA